MGIEMERSMRVIKENALVETAICLTCHRRFRMEKVLKHNMDIHGGDQTQFCDKIVTYSSIKVIHGICKEKRLYQDKQKILSFALKIFCKTPNESIIECMGSIAELHTKPQRNCNFKLFETELMVDWIGAKFTKGPGILRKVIR